MLKNFIKIGLRNLIRNKGISLINISGLAVGIACSLLIFAYVVDETNYDDFYENQESLYRVQLHRTFPGRESWFATTPIPMGATLTSDMPEVADATRLFEIFNELQVSPNGEDQFFETKILAADSNFFKVFSFPFADGSKNDALLTPNTLVLSESTAIKYFGRSNVVGETLELQGNQSWNVGGVIKDLPKRSHFEFDILLSFNSFPQVANNNFWGSYSCYNYVKLKEGVNPSAIETKIPQVIEQYMGPQVESIVGTAYEDYVAAGNNHNYFLMPLRDIHLKSNLQREIKPNGNINYIYFFSLIAVMILVIACFNFMNLSTAASVKRAKEVGMRKVLGSEKRWLVAQFLTESIVVTCISTLLATGLFFYQLPFFNDLAGKNIAISDFSIDAVAFLLLSLILVVGVFAGSYPAFFISSFGTLKILKGGLKLQNKKWSLRNILVVSQFGVSVFLVVATLLIIRQTNHMMNQSLGFEKDQILVIERANATSNLEQFMSSLKSSSAVKEVSATVHVPGRQIGGGTFEAIGIPATERYLFDAMTVDYNFAEAYGLKLIKGRFYDDNLPSDTASVVINQATVDMVGWDDPIGKEILPTSGTRLKIIGVVEDFHYASLHEQISPLVFFGIPRRNLMDNPPSLLSVRIEAGNNMNQAVDFIEGKWSEWNPGNNPEYSFLDAEFDSLYEQEQNFASIFSSLASLAIFIAIVGVLGLSAFISAQRIKEVGIRKVLGASISQLLLLLSVDFVQLVLIANLLVAPLLYFALSEWLSNYPYSVGVPLDLLVFTALGSMVIVIMAVSYHAYRAAITNPSKTLKCE
ncbi:MAG: ABC transporter permease [Cyclobacteriaceae bacterium]